MHNLIIADVFLLDCVFAQAFQIRCHFNSFWAIFRREKKNCGLEFLFTVSQQMVSTAIEQTLF